jgi:hypothetical protein
MSWFPDRGWTCNVIGTANSNIDWFAINYTPRLPGVIEIYDMPDYPNSDGQVLVGSIEVDGSGAYKGLNASSGLGELKSQYTDAVTGHTADVYTYEAVFRPHGQNRTYEGFFASSSADPVTVDPAALDPLVVPNPTPGAP